VLESSYVRRRCGGGDSTRGWPAWWACRVARCTPWPRARSTSWPSTWRANGL